MYSDGVPETMDAADRQFGTDGVRGVFAATGACPRAAVEALAAAVRRHTAGGSQYDDITLVCFTRAPD
jgi:serine phosphatase RsbU (regulator of sigma subunit)